ncbi:hypothetical protein [Chamaesiphon minutus]|uniref:hypothetical protein n=1 Tax=Chamaesiphon minutus TaxID=1173032 RepID=UPI0012FC7111|nr:hypothetical protein [Chamaesiphon minutus]
MPKILPQYSTRQREFTWKNIHSIAVFKASGHSIKIEDMTSARPILLAAFRNNFIV